jgi:hypothetical protein
VSRALPSTILAGRRSAVTPTQAVAALIAAATAIRILFACAIGLGVDESYMVAAGRHVRLSYFDHPPLAWWLSAAAAHLAGSEAAIIVRLPFIALFALTTWLIYRLTATLFGAWAGVWAAVTLTLSPVFGVTTGSWVLPDGPLDCALVAAALCLVRGLCDGGLRWWLAVGAAAGLALLSKYSAALTIAGALVYLTTQPQHRAWLRRPHPYAAGLLALAIFAPVVAWNAAHGWASFGFQAGRAEAAALHPLAPLAVLAGEALFVLPWIWIPMAVALVCALRRGPREWRGWLLACLGVPPIAVFSVVALWSHHVLFHWAAPGYLMLFPLLGEAMTTWRPKLRRGGVTVTSALMLAVLALVFVQFRWPLLQLGRFVRDGQDPMVQAIDWSPLLPALDARGLLDRPNLVLAATDWQDAGKLDVGFDGSVPVTVLSRDPRQYGIVANFAGHAGQDLLIVSSKPTDAAALAFQGARFASLTELPPLTIAVIGGRRLTFRLYEARGLRVQPAA